MCRRRFIPACISLFTSTRVACWGASSDVHPVYQYLYIDRDHVLSLGCIYPGDVHPLVPAVYFDRSRVLFYICLRLYPLFYQSALSWLLYIWSRRFPRTSLPILNGAVCCDIPDDVYLLVSVCVYVDRGRVL